MNAPERWGGRCDLCHCLLEIGEVVYTLFTPSTGSREDAEAGRAFWAEDPRWGVCSDCMVGIKLLDAGVLSRDDWLVRQTDKSLRNQRLVVIGGNDADGFAQSVRQDQLEFVVRVLKGFVDNRIPEVREEINEGVPRSDA